MKSEACDKQHTLRTPHIEVAACIQVFYLSQIEKTSDSLYK